MKAIGYFSSPGYTNRPFLLCVTRIREDRITTRDLMVFCHYGVLSSFCLQHGLDFRFVSDCPSLSYVLDTSGPAGSAPCPICPVVKEVKKDKTTEKRKLMNADEFYSENDLER